MNFADCQCDKCMKKRPSEGFFKAPKAMHESAAALQSDLDYWMESRVGFDPKRGNPAMDNTVERPRTALHLKAFLASTRAKYPRAFRP